MAVTKEYAVAVDTELADLYDQIWVINSQIRTMRADMKSYEKSSFASFDQKNEYAKKILNKCAMLLEKRMPLNARVEELDAAYNLDPWTRAFLVINSNGHVHSSMACTTCFSTTRYNWLVQYSNDNEATIVADAGQDACTVCYPTAPAETLNRPSRIVTADKIAKAEAKAARDAKREAKLAKAKAIAPTASGEPLVITYPDTMLKNIDGQLVSVPVMRKEEIKTERTAVTEWLNNAMWATNTDNAEYIAKKTAINNQIVEALAGKHGVTVEEELTMLNAKLAKRK